MKPADETRSAHLPDIAVPAAYLIGGPSKFTNIYAPVPETILLNQEVVPGQLASASVKHGQTKSLQDYRGAGRRARLRTWLELATNGGGRVTQMGERIVYDARWVYNGNVAHLFGHHLGNLGFAKEMLGVGPEDCLVVLEKDTPRIAHDFFDLVGYETHETNGVVQANVLAVDFDHTATYHLIPYIRHLEPPDVASNGPRRLFISRRTSRRITNEQEILAMCVRENYEPIYFEDIPIKTQWSLLKHASSVVSIHGAALGFLNTRGGAGMSPHFDLLEIFSPGLVADCYRKMTAVVGGHWIGCRGKVTSVFHACVEESSNYKATDALDFHLDPGALALAFEKLTLRA